MLVAVELRPDSLLPGAAKNPAYRVNELPGFFTGDECSGRCHEACLGKLI